MFQTNRELSISVTIIRPLHAQQQATRLALCDIQTSQTINSTADSITNYTMAEITAFSRRHRVGEALLPNVAAHHHDRTLVIPSNTIKVSRKKDKKTATAAANATTIVVEKAPARKMNSTQLRMFFLLCVSLYLGTICFADEIVGFARWVSGDGDHKWNYTSTVSAPPSPGISDGNRRDASELHVNAPATPVVVEAGPSPTPARVEAATKKQPGGGLRGATDTQSPSVSTQPLVVSELEIQDTNKNVTAKDEEPLTKPPQVSGDEVEPSINPKAPVDDKEAAVVPANTEAVKDEVPVLDAEPNTGDVAEHVSQESPLAVEGDGARNANDSAV